MALQRMIKYNDSYTKKYLKKIEYNKFKVILVPIENNNHWALMAIYPQEKLVLRYDGVKKHKNDMSDIHDVKKFIMPFVSTEWQNFKHKCISTGPKCDENRSGDFICFIAKNIIEGIKHFRSRRKQSNLQ
jgi:Ulp1 family protease